MSSANFFHGGRSKGEVCSMLWGMLFQIVSSCGVTDDLHRVVWSPLVGLLLGGSIGRGAFPVLGELFCVHFMFSLM